MTVFRELIYYVGYCDKYVIHIKHCSHYHLHFYFADRSMKTPDQNLRILNLSRGLCALPNVCIYGNTTQDTYNQCYHPVPSYSPMASDLPPGNWFCGKNELELCINITEMLNGSAYATLFYTVVCVSTTGDQMCGNPASQLVVQNFQLIVPPDGMLPIMQFSCVAVLSFSY